MSNKQYWWDSYGPFDPDPNDSSFPNAGQVVRYYRLLKKWSPAQLGEALDKSARWVQAMEHDNTVPESISRRRALAIMLGIPPVLLGLASIENVATIPEPKNATRAARKPSIDIATLGQYNEILHLYWELDYTSTAQESIEDIERWIQHLRRIAPDARGNQQPVIELMCRYHQLANWIARDQRDYATAFTHANRAVKLALSVGNSELIAAALFRRGRTSLEQGNINAATTDLDTALPYAQRARPQLKGLVLLAAGHAHAHAIEKASTDIIQTRTLIEHASRIVRRGNLEEDESFVKLNTGRYHLDKAGALIALGQSEDALDELDLADKGVGPDQTRRHAYINVLRAQAYTSMGEFEIATSVAEDALGVSKAINSVINIARIEEIYKEISYSKYGGSPQVGRLKLLLASR
jgi:tetratricopeptide (TPR) repeat protein